MRKLLLAPVLFAASSYSSAEIVINDWLSFEGFIDMSYTHTDTSFDARLNEAISVTGGSTDFDIPPGSLPEQSFNESSYAVDQVEINWLFDFDPVTAQIDIAYFGGDDSYDSLVEQAFATYHFDYGGAMTVGRYQSMLGFEAFEPTGLYQYSTAYTLPLSDAITSALAGSSSDPIEDAIVGFFGLIRTTVAPLPGYAQGVKYTYETDRMFAGLSLQDGVYSYRNNLGGSGSDTDGDFVANNGGWGIEGAFSYDLGNGLTFFIGGAAEDGDGYSIDGTPLSTGGTSAWVVNSYVTYETGDWIFAAEVNVGEAESDFIPGFLNIDTETVSGLLMANYAYSDKASVTARLSIIDYRLGAGIPSAPFENGAAVDIEVFKYTLAHSYAFTDNLVLVAEVSAIESDTNLGASFDDGPDDFLRVNADLEAEQVFGAIELIFTF